MSVFFRLHIQSNPEPQNSEDTPSDTKNKHVARDVLIKMSEERGKEYGREKEQENTKKGEGGRRKEKKKKKRRKSQRKEKEEGKGEREGGKKGEGRGKKCQGVVLLLDLSSATQLGDCIDPP